MTPKSPGTGLSGHVVDLGVSGLLVVVDVAAGLADHLVAGPTVEPNGDQIGHRAAGHEEGSLLVEQLGHAVLQAMDRGIVAKNVVAHVGAAAIAARIPAVGWVTVSLRKSRGFSGMAGLSEAASGGKRHYHERRAESEGDRSMFSANNCRQWSVSEPKNGPVPGLCNLLHRS